MLLHFFKQINKLFSCLGKLDVPFLRELFDRGHKALAKPEVELLFLLELLNVPGDN